MTEARGEIGLETLADRRKSARVSLLMKIIADDSDSSAVIRDSFSEIVANMHDYNTRMSQTAVPFTLQSHTVIFHHSFVPRTTRDLRLSTV